MIQYNYQWSTNFDDLFLHPDSYENREICFFIEISMFRNNTMLINLPVLINIARSLEQIAN